MLENNPLCKNCSHGFDYHYESATIPTRTGCTSLVHSNVRMNCSCDCFVQYSIDDFWKELGEDK